jgi:hypothetical protein
MQSPLRSQGSGWVGVAGAAGMLVSVLMLSGCPGTLDPTQFNTNGTGGSGSGTGGSNSTGGSNGTGGSSANCTGANDPTTIIMMNCATASCHIPGPLNAGASGGLDLTVDANIRSRLVDVTSTGTVDNGSMCVGNTEPYLKSGSNPATGLLIQKIQSNPKCSPSESPPCCGYAMPYPGVVALPAQQQTCLIQWATTLTSP